MWPLPLRTRCPRGRARTPPISESRQPPHGGSRRRPLTGSGSSKRAPGRGSRKGAPGRAAGSRGRPPASRASWARVARFWGGSRRPGSLCAPSPCAGCCAKTSTRVTPSASFLPTSTQGRGLHPPSRVRKQARRGEARPGGRKWAVVAGTLQAWPSASWRVEAQDRRVAGSPARPGRPDPVRARDFVTGADRRVAPQKWALGPPLRRPSCATFGDRGPPALVDLLSSAAPGGRSSCSLVP